jgi:hypothetical protein
VKIPTNIPDEPISFRANEHRQSKQIVQAVKISMQPPPALKTKTSVTHLQPAPPPPTLSAPPINRRRSPAPNGPQPQPQQSQLQPQTSSSNLQASASRAMDSATSNYSNLGTSNDLAGLASPRYRSRTPVSAAPSNSATGPPSPSVYRRQPGGGSSPPSSATPLPRGDSSASGYFSGGSMSRTERERPPRSVRGSPVPRTNTSSPAPGPPPPRSVNRPGSSMGRPQPQPPVAVPQRQGMI